MDELKILDPKSRVWIYQSDKKFSIEEADNINRQIRDFTKQWTSHNQALRAYGKLYYQQFVVLIVDETQAGASGCSIDKSVQFIKVLERDFNVDFFNRQIFYFKSKSDIIPVHQHELPSSYAAGKIQDDSMVFDALVKTKDEFENAWLKPLHQSWHKQFL